MSKETYGGVVIDVIGAVRLLKLFKYLAERPEVVARIVPEGMEPTCDVDELRRFIGKMASMCQVVHQQLYEPVLESEPNEEEEEMVN